MLKNISNLGKTLNKADQKLITGGRRPDQCFNHNDCGPSECCQSPTTQNWGYCGPRENGTGACNGEIPHDL
ncbi:hypothetical protein [uncultured Dokdonia sp.]|uniref:hypothetical protein n=1 Tax=uncultured Dokdonia sp. TaxID=575653 RepID=UPI0026175AFE|nr:hypothetical protein [uncultured Dokdonia sp.]